MHYNDYAREREMEMSKKSSSGGGIGFLGLLAIVFITLKLVGVITRSWLWVTAPLWGGFVLIVLFAILAVVLQPTTTSRWR